MKKIALVIGVNKYEHFEVLDNCENDASDIHNFLETYGFEVTPIINPTKVILDEAIEEYKSKLEKDCVALFYFSGHGLKEEQYNFIVAADSVIEQPQDIAYNSTNLAQLFSDIPDDLEFTQILILDACRKNLFGTGLGKVTAGLGLEAPRKGTVVAYSASPGKASIERTAERNGVYTKHLLRNLQIPNLSIEQVFKNTRTDVLRDTKGGQTPWDESSLFGDVFSFVEVEEVALEFQELLDSYIISEKNLLLQEILPFVQPRYFYSLPLEHLHLALSLLSISFEEESDGIVQPTVDPDYMSQEMVDNYLPLYHTRLYDEDKSDTVFDLNVLNDIKVSNSKNYGFNEVLEVDEAFCHFMSNDIVYNGQPGLLSCFLSFEENEHWVKPNIYLKSNPLTIYSYAILKGEAAVSFVQKYVTMRTPYEKEPLDLMNAFESGEVISLDKFFADFDEEQNQSTES